MKRNREKTLLIVDDTVENIEILNHLLKERYRIKAARSGEKALQIVQEGPTPDLILLDIMMPGMDGYEVIGRLKQDPKTAHIPVIFVTALGETFDQTRAFALGAADYIIKPVTPEIVIARIATHIALHDKQQYLKARIKEEAAKRIEQERVLLRQSRLAAMGEMMSVITHQWSQPLSVIGAVSAMLQVSAQLGTLEKEEVLKELKTVDRNLAFMSQTMVDFKAFFKSGGDPRPFRVADEIRSVVSMLDPLLKKHTVAIELDIGNDVTGVGIANEFKQVILNLISNAKDAIEERRAEETFEPRITITARQEGQFSIVTVADNGGGIPEDAMERIFENDYTTKAEHGSGIGLAMSRMIVEERMHGSIRAANLGEGACFTLELPSAHGDQKA